LIFNMQYWCRLRPVWDESVFAGADFPANKRRVEVAGLRFRQTAGGGNSPDRAPEFTGDAAIRQIPGRFSVLMRQPEIASVKGS
jgi:hypothetical protein